MPLPPIQKQYSYLPSGKARRELGNTLADEMGDIIDRLAPIILTLTSISFGTSKPWTRIIQNGRGFGIVVSNLAVNGLMVNSFPQNGWF